MHAVTTEPATFSGRSCKNILKDWPPASGPSPSSRNANLVGSSKSILRSPDNAVIVMRSPRNREPGIDNVFRAFLGPQSSRPWLCDRLKNRDGAILASNQELVRHFPTCEQILSWTRSTQRRRSDRVDNDSCRFQPLTREIFSRLVSGRM